MSMDAQTNLLLVIPRNIVATLIIFANFKNVSVEFSWVTKCLSVKWFQQYFQKQ